MLLNPPSKTFTNGIVCAPVHSFCIKVTLSYKKNEPIIELESHVYTYVVGKDYFISHDYNIPISVSIYDPSDGVILS